MKLAGQRAAVILTEDGQAVLALASVELPDAPLFIVLIEEVGRSGVVGAPATRRSNAPISIEVGIYFTESTCRAD